MSPQDKSYDRLVASSAESAALMSSLVKDLDQLLSSEMLAELPLIRNELRASRDQLDVASIALYTEIETVTRDDAASTTGSSEFDSASDRRVFSDRPKLRVVDAGFKQGTRATIGGRRRSSGHRTPANETFEPSNSSANDGTANGDPDDDFKVALPPLPMPEVRRAISIPEEIAHDDDAVARAVASAPNVILLVEGDAVARLGWPSFPPAEQRVALITYVAELSAKAGCAPDVVFDGRIGPQGTTHESTLVRIRLTKPPTAPVQALDELIDAYPMKWSLALVTDDEELASTAAKRHVAVLSGRQLLNLFNPF